MLFPWLSDIEPMVLTKIDQKRTEPGDPGVGDDELNQVFNAEHRYLWERLSSMDRDFNILTDDTTTVTANTQTTALPTDIRVLRAVYEINSAGDVIRQIDAGAWHELANGASCDREALFQPYPTAQLYWLNKPSRAMTLRVVYSGHPPHLFHGCVQGAGATTVEVETFEPTEDSVGLTRNIYIPEGDGAGQERTVSAYTGSDYEITVSLSFSPVPTGRSRYTSRPALPPDLIDAFVYGSCARLVEKYQDHRYLEFTQQRLEKLNAAFTALNTLDRRGPLETYDVDDFGHGDPDWDWGY